MSDNTTPRPVFIPGIGPPLSQIREDYAGSEQALGGQVVHDVLALIDAVDVLVAIAEAAGRLRVHLSQREPMQFKTQEGCDAWNQFSESLAVWRERKERR